MIYFHNDEILFSVLSFFVLGILSGGIYTSLVCFFLFIKVCVSTPKRLYLKYKNKINTRIKIEQNFEKTKIGIQLSDFTFVYFWGILFILFSYLFLDGLFRIYTLAVFGIGYFVSKKTLGQFFSKAILFLLNFTLRTIDFVFNFILYPFFIAADILKRLISPIIVLIQKKYRREKYKLLLNKKLKEIENLNF